MRLTDKEFTTLENRLKNTTCNKLSDYVRRCLFDKPITTVTRDAATDDLIVKMSEMNFELNAIGSNFNQLVKRINTSFQYARFSETLGLIMMQRDAVTRKMEEIKNELQKLAEKWLR
ncbi:plasmid mobilization relaxosome protein MobC [Flavobacterium sp. NRK1]|uniref:plasmid mobilization protein n=1 Tax=Flavobacterium sp. NRK1 TaxID=2954929 RepID=UPI0020928E61|nr:plasmid mobilization relaxosome protein MobC [Flavobacterium sp. NRK1]MCO6148954.1 plasmid mobilization relaxosome protein MobC [Flavobacterium sp. NRK1]